MRWANSAAQKKDAFHTGKTLVNFQLQKKSDGLACNGPLVFCRMRSRLRETTHFVKKCVPSRSKHMFLNWWWRDPGPYHLSSNRLKSDFFSKREHANNNSYVDSCGRGCCAPRGDIWPGWPRMLYRTRELMGPDRVTQQTRHRHIYIYVTKNRDIYICSSASI